jgi:hypothetical protein
MLNLDERFSDIVDEGLIYFSDIEPVDYLYAIRNRYLTAAKEMINMPSEFDNQFGEYLCGLAEQLQVAIEAEETIFPIALYQ